MDGAVRGHGGGAAGAGAAMVRLAMHHARVERRRLLLATHEHDAASTAGMRRRGRPGVRKGWRWGLRRRRVVEVDGGAEPLLRRIHCHGHDDTEVWASQRRVGCGSTGWGCRQRQSGAAGLRPVMAAGRERSCRRAAATSGVECGGDGVRMALVGGRQGRDAGPKFERARLGEREMRPRGGRAGEA